jgi:saccharopine dehydrogenase (NADP+, L-glutamate forming)/spermidine synthase
MRKVVILGAGLVSKPLADYFMDHCNYQVVMATRTVSKAQQIIGDRALGTAVAWTTDKQKLLDELVSSSDLVVSMIPPTMHIPVAEACIKHRKNMVTTSYISPQMAALDQQAKEAGIIILNEIGEDPGLDHMGAKQMIDNITGEGGRVTGLTSYGAGLPAFEYNRNPLGYKFSWSPRGVMMAAQTPAAYLKNGQQVEVPAADLFNHHWLVDVEGIGTFETYPNRDSTRYVDYFELEKDVSLYRGLLRFMGWCSTMRCLIKLNLLDGKEEKSFENINYAAFTASLIGSDSPKEIRKQAAQFLELDLKSDEMERLNWLGLFSDSPISLSSGANVDVLVNLMLQKMSYQPGERDMIIVHDEVEAKFPDHLEIRTSSLRMEGIPNGDSAMSRAVSLPAAVASRLILEEQITVLGVHMPTLPEIYQPVLQELETFGFRFSHQKKVSSK